MEQIFVVTKKTSFTSTSSKKEITSLRIAVAGRSVWISSENFEQYVSKYDERKGVVSLPVPFKDNFDLVKKHAENGDFLCLLPKWDMGLAVV